MLVKLTAVKSKQDIIVKIAGREIETANFVPTKTGWILAFNDLEIFDPYYLSVPKEFEALHKELYKILKHIEEVDKLYSFLLSTDSIRKRHFSDLNIMPYYCVPLVTAALLRSHACLMQNGMLKKRETFTRFLIYRDEVIAEATGRNAMGTDTVKDFEKISAEEEKASRKYRLPPMDELKAMNYEMITLEMAKAEELMAKPKYMKVLKNLRTEKSSTKIRKTEKQVMKEAIDEERAAALEDVAPVTRLAKHQKRKAEQARKDKARFEKSHTNGKAGKVTIASAEGEYVG